MTVELFGNAWDQPTLPVAKVDLEFVMPLTLLSQLTCHRFPDCMRSSFNYCHLINTVYQTSMIQHSLQKYQSGKLEWWTQQWPNYSRYFYKENVLDEPLVRAQELRVLPAAPNQAGKARLIRVAAPHTGAFLDARLCSSLGTWLDNASLRTATALCLGAQVCLPHTCACEVSFDSTGRHGLSCRKEVHR